MTKMNTNRKRTAYMVFTSRAVMKTAPFAYLSAIIILAQPNRKHNLGHNLGVNLGINLGHNLGCPDRTQDLRNAEKRHCIRTATSALFTPFQQPVVLHMPQSLRQSLQKPVSWCR